MDTIEELEIIEYGEINFCYKLSLPVFSIDWDSEEDNHWDNY